MTDTPIALVTGGAQGIGYACGEALKADGFKVILADINESVMASADKLGGVGILCDMADPAAVTAMFDQIEADHGPVAALVNNAGIAAPGDFLDYDLQTFQKVIDINLVGTFTALQRAARTMVEKGIEGAIVNMSSINAQVAIPAIPAYCASKGGVMQLTKSASLALAPHNIRVNAVNPTVVMTPMSEWYWGRDDIGGPLLDAMPLHRWATEEDCAAPIVFLLSDAASMISGVCLPIDGGFTAV